MERRRRPSETASGSLRRRPRWRDDILAYAKTLLPPASRCVSLTRPSAQALFIRPLQATFPAKRIGEAKGFEIDPHYGRPAARAMGRHQPSIKLGDFTHAASRTPALIS